MQYILANTRKLANSKVTNVSIVPDLTHQARKKEEELRKEADTVADIRGVIGVIYPPLESWG